VPFVVLTDGKTWSFYLPAEQGSYEDRRVYKLDLFERPVAESSATLERYLAQKRVESGEALDTARKEYRSRNRKSQARAAIPDAWRELVEKGDESLVELLGGAVESKIGCGPMMTTWPNTWRGWVDCAAGRCPGYRAYRHTRRQIQRRRLLFSVKLANLPAVVGSFCAEKPMLTRMPKTRW
jgi:hypothetical protein